MSRMTDAREHQLLTLQRVGIPDLMGGGRYGAAVALACDAIQKYSGPPVDNFDFPVLIVPMRISIGELIARVSLRGKLGSTSIGQKLDPEPPWHLDRDFMVCFGVDMGDEAVKGWPSDVRSIFHTKDRCGLSSRATVAAALYEPERLESHPIFALETMVHCACTRETCGTMIHHDTFAAVDISSDMNPVLVAAGIADRAGTPCEAPIRGLASRFKSFAA